tara:strand:+ start:460 stop:1656 length:1197 start_codon:yes stop_codon:yes gene_type:complete
MAESPVLNLGSKIASKSTGAMKGVIKSSNNLSKSILENIKIKKRIKNTSERFQKIRNERKKRKQKEALLEEQKLQEQGEGEKSMGSEKTPVGRLMSIIQTLLIGFVLNKLPQIINFIKKVIKVIRDIVDKFKAFFDGVVGFFKSTGKVIGNALNFISNLEFSDVGDAIKNAFGKIKDSFNNIKDKLLDGVKSFLGMKNKKPEDMKKEEKKNEQKSSVSDVKETLSGKSDEFNKTLDTIKKEGTGIDIVGDENKELTSEVDDKKYIRLTLTDVDTNYTVDELESKVDSTKSKINKMEEEGANERKIEFEQDKLDVYEKALDRKKSETPPVEKKLNISAPKKEIKTTTITPERKSKNMVMIVGNKNGQSQTQMGMRTKSRTRTIVQKDNSLKDQFALSLF